MKSLTRLLLSLMLTNLFPFSYAYANSNDVIVVTASGFDQGLIDAPASISVITQDELEKKSVSSIADALSTVEGVNVLGATGKTGGLDISIRGMPSEYTLILVDGRRQSDSSDVTPNGFGSVNTSFLPPISAIERIEVIRGPMSTLYGSDAMGGVINIITKKISDQWGTNLKADMMLHQSRREGDTQQISLFTSGPLLAEKVGLAIRANFSHRDDSDRLPAGVSADQVTVSKRGPNPVKSTNYTVGGRLTYTPLSSQTFWLDVEQAKQAYDNRDSELGTRDKPGRATGYKDKLNFNRNQFAAGHTYYAKNMTWESSLMYKETETEGRTIPAAAVPTGSLFAGRDRVLKNKHVIADTKWLVPLFDAHLLTVGGQAWRATMRDGLVVINGGDTFSQTMLASFIEDEFRISERLSLTTGLRYDYHNAFKSHFSPRGYLVWNANDNWTVKGGVSRGYKTPTLAQLHKGINGISGQGTIVTLGNPDLKPEISTSTEIGFYYRNDMNFSSSVTLFYNRFNDKIATGDPLYNCDFPSSPNRPNCITVPGFQTTQDEFGQQVNVDSAITKGIEVAMTLPFNDVLSLDLRYGYTGSEQKSGSNRGEQLNNTPIHSANFTLNWRVNPRLSAWFQGQYQGSSARFNARYENLSGQNKALYDSLGNFKNYILLNLGGRYQLSETITINAALYNLLNKNFMRYQPYQYRGDTYYANPYIQSGTSTSGNLPEGRRLWLSTTLLF